MTFKATPIFRFPGYTRCCVRSTCRLCAKQPSRERSQPEIRTIFRGFPVVGLRRIRERIVQRCSVDRVQHHRILSLTDSEPPHRVTQSRNPFRVSFDGHRGNGSEGRATIGCIGRLDGQTSAVGRFDLEEENGRAGLGESESHRRARISRRRPLPRPENFRSVVSHLAETFPAAPFGGLMAHAGRPACGFHGFFIPFHRSAPPRCCAFMRQTIGRGPSSTKHEGTT